MPDHWRSRQFQWAHSTHFGGDWIVGTSDSFNVQLDGVCNKGRATSQANTDSSNIAVYIGAVGQTAFRCCLGAVATVGVKFQCFLWR